MDQFTQDLDSSEILLYSSGGSEEWVHFVSIVPAQNSLGFAHCGISRTLCGEEAEESMNPCERFPSFIVDSVSWICLNLDFVRRAGR